MYLIHNNSPLYLHTKYIHTTHTMYVYITLINYHIKYRISMVRKERSHLFIRKIQKKTPINYMCMDKSALENVLQLLYLNSQYICVYVVYISIKCICT